MFAIAQMGQTMIRTILPPAVAAALLLALGLAPGCKREPPPAGETAEAADTPAASAAPSAEVELVDVVETTPDYVIGISYPQSAGEYPLLAAELERYAEAARAELMRALSGRPPGAPMLDLSLSFTEVARTPAVVGYAADGSVYTGGAHGIPLLQRWVWLPQQRELLTAQALVPQPAGWEAVSRFVREQLYSQLSQQLDAAELEPAVRAEQMESAGRMIDDGTAPEPANFSRFEPVVGPGGRLVAIRFVFPPYQVAPYAAGVQSVEVPAALLLPHVAPEYRQLFATGQRGAPP